MSRAGATATTTEFGGMVLSADEQSAEFCGRTVLLSHIEFRLLACLVSALGKVVTHDYLMSHVWGAEYVNSRHKLHLYIRYLRKSWRPIGRTHASSSASGGSAIDSSPCLNRTFVDRCPPPPGSYAEPVSFAAFAVA